MPVFAVVGNAIATVATAAVSTVGTIVGTVGGVIGTAVKAGGALLATKAGAGIAGAAATSLISNAIQNKISGKQLSEQEELAYAQLSAAEKAAAEERIRKEKESEQLRELAEKSETQKAQAQQIETLANLQIAKQAVSRSGPVVLTTTGGARDTSFIGRINSYLHGLFR